VQVGSGHLIFQPGYSDQAENRHAEHRQPKINIDDRKNLALNDYIVLKNLQRAQRGIAFGAAAVQDQAGILRERRAQPSRPVAYRPRQSSRCRRAPNTRVIQSL
jgi:hypothetical protein